MTEEQKKYLLIAEKAAKKAGEYLRKEMNSNIRVVKELDRDIKLEVDYHSESLLINTLQHESNFPILTEERGLINANSNEHSKHQWIVDPLDGSLNFSRKIPLCCISIALWKDEKPFLGIIYDFNRNEMFSGLVDTGAWLNGIAITTSNANKKSNSVLAMGFPVSTDFSREALTTFVLDVVEYKKVRLLGSAALSLAYVACGRIDSYKENDIKIWDVAAGLALVKAAGGAIFYKSSLNPYVFNVSGASTKSLL